MKYIKKRTVYNKKKRDRVGKINQRHLLNTFKKMFFLVFK